MKRSNFLIAAGFALCITMLADHRPLEVQADTVTDIKSRGVISYDNSDSTENSVAACFDASDLVLLENRIKEIEAKIESTEAKLKITSVITP